MKPLSVAMRALLLPLLTLLFGLGALTLLEPSLAVAVPAIRALEDTAPSGIQSWALVPADAQGPDGRGAIEHVLEPGDVYEDHVAVRNIGSALLTVELSAHGAVQTPDNGFGLVDGDEAPPVIASWVELDAERVTVGPGASRVVQVRFHVPADAEPGDHAAGIVALNVTGLPAGGDPRTPKADGTPGSDVQYRVGARVHLRVAGPVDPGLRIDGVRAEAPATILPFAGVNVPVSATLVNTGNVRLSPTAQVRAQSLFGAWNATVPLAGAPGTGEAAPESAGGSPEGTLELLPEGAHTLVGAVAGVPQLGPIWLTVEVPKVLSIGQDVSALLVTESVTVVVWVVPWTMIVFVLLLAIAIALAVRNLLARRNAKLAETSKELSEPEHQEPASVATLGE